MKLQASVTVVVAGDSAVAVGEIENQQLAVPALPLTGGIGSYLLLIGGGLFIGLHRLPRGAHGTKPRRA